MLGLQRESAGDILLDGKSVGGLAADAARRARNAIQYVHQDAGAALDPWWSIGRTLAEGLLIQGVQDRAERQERVARDAGGGRPRSRRRRGATRTNSPAASCAASRSRASCCCSRAS